MSESPRESSTGSAAVTVLQRWEDSGATWRVVSRSGSRLEVALVTCTGDEEMERLTSCDPVLLTFVGDRASSED